MSWNSRYAGEQPDLVALQQHAEQERDNWRQAAGEHTLRAMHHQDLGDPAMREKHESAGMVASLMADSLEHHLGLLADPLVNPQHLIKSHELLNRWRHVGAFHHNLAWHMELPEDGDTTP